MTWDPIRLREPNPEVQQFRTNRFVVWVYHFSGLMFYTFWLGLVLFRSAQSFSDRFFVINNQNFHTRYSLKVL